MAKYSRFDVRNKKKNRKKYRTQSENVTRIKRVKIRSKSGLLSLKSMVEYSYTEEENT
jgi:hypothetical protein